MNTCCFPLPFESASPIKDLTMQVAMSEVQVSASGQTQTRLSEWKGQVIVLFIFGPDCGTCKHLARIISNVRREYAHDIKCVGICVQTGCREKLADFAIQTHAAFPLTYCSTRELCPALGIPKGTWLFYPTVIFIDREQRLRGLFVGNHPFFAAPEFNVQGVLSELIAETSQFSNKVEVSA